MLKISGYFLEASNPGGLTIHPWIGRPSKESNENSSTSPKLRSASRLSLTAVRRVHCAGCCVENVTMSGGSDGVERIIATCPSADTVNGSPEAYPLLNRTLPEVIC